MAVSNNARSGRASPERRFVKCLPKSHQPSTSVSKSLILDAGHKPVCLADQQLRFIRRLIVERGDFEHAVDHGGFRQFFGMSEAVHAQKLGVKKLCPLHQIFFGIALGGQPAVRMAANAGAGSR